MNSSKSFWQISAKVPKESASLVEHFFLEAGAEGFYELLYQEGVTDNLNEDNTTLFFFFPEAFPARAFAPMALAALGIDSNTVVVERIGFSDYIKAFEDSFRSFELTPTLWLVPPWDEDNLQIPQTARRLRLRPGLAFGTGKHPTSRLMISFLEQNLLPGNSVFDLGCGSGILALSAKLLGAGKTLGVDVEQISVDSATENAELNQWSTTDIQFLQGDFSFLNDERYFTADIFLANILPQIFRQNLVHLLVYLRSAKIWALSGIADHQQQSFAELLTDNGVNFEWELKEEWLIFYSREAKRPAIGERFSEYLRTAQD